jgi:hypothetical protein
VNYNAGSTKQKGCTVSQDTAAISSTDCGSVSVATSTTDGFGTSKCIPVSALTSVTSRYSGKFTSCTNTWTSESYTGIDDAAVKYFTSLKSYTSSISTTLTPIKTSLNDYNTDYAGLGKKLKD